MKPLKARLFRAIGRSGDSGAEADRPIVSGSPACAVFVASIVASTTYPGIHWRGDVVAGTALAFASAYFARRFVTWAETGVPAPRGAVEFDARD